MNKNSTPHNREKDSNALIHLWKSPWTSWVGFRYLKSKKNSRFLSFITLLSIMGVGLGVTAMIVVLSVMDGFESELKKRMMSSDLHILVQPTQEVASFDRGFVAADALNPALVDSVLKDKSHPVLSFSPVVSTEAILKTGRKVSGIVLKGVPDERLVRLKSQIVEAAEPKQLILRRPGEPTVELPGIFLGQELAYEMGLIPGDQVTLISPTEFEGPVEGIPRLKRYAVEGIYHSGMPEQELHTVYARQAPVYSFLRKSGVVSQWEITVSDFSEAPSLASHIRDLAPQFRVQDWVQMNSHLFASLKLERLSMFVILAFIIIVASFNIVTTLTLMVLEKKREISILKAMGARNGQVAAVFLAEGALIGGVGVGGGIILGWLICLGLKRYEFITLPDIYYDRTLPVTFDLKYYVIVSLCALLIVLAACLYPSRRAAKLDPLEGIRFG
ncbi:MAG: FtsX-like permease family protein [Bdellovibrionia bacterium]